MLPKVSVIIPIYKVEPYLNRCVDSILNQTYVNIEVILVDDGSPDRCGLIADHYAEMDQRVSVIHKPNGGLSDARNAGMQKASGTYTIFVDSDDWVERTMIEQLVDHSYRFQADIVQASFYYAYEDHLQWDHRYYAMDAPPVLLNNERLMSELIRNEKVKNFAWGKLYKTNLIRDLPFKKGVLFEDVFWAHQVMHRVRRYVIFHQPLYYYFQRDDSIVANYTPKSLDILKGMKERHRFIEKHYPHLTDESYQAILKASLIHYSLLTRNRERDKGGKNRKEIRAYISDHIPMFKNAIQAQSQLKQQLALFNIHPLFHFVYLLARKVLRRVRILPQPTGLRRINL